jgi:hypothetical protein
VALGFSVGTAASACSVLLRDSLRAVASSPRTMSLGNASAGVENHKHRMLATEYGIIGYTPAEPQKNHLRAGEVHANELARKLVTDTSVFADRRVQAFKGPLGDNARVLIGILTCNGARIDGGMMVKQSDGGKAWGRIEKERKQAREKGQAMAALELMEYSFVARTQIHGFWSDPNKSDIEKVTADDVLELVREYNDVAPVCEDRLVAMSLLRRADRLTADPGLVGQTSETRKLRVLTMNNLASQWRRRGRLTDAQRCLQTAQVIADTLGAPPAKIKSASQVSEHAICVLRVRAEGLLNLDENGIGGLSDPFLRVSRTVNKAEKEKDERKLENKHGHHNKHGGVHLNLRSWRAATDAVIVQTQQVTGKPVHKTEVVMNSLNPDWKRFRLMATQLCGCDLQRPISLAVLDWDRDGTHDLIGSVQLSFLEMQKRVRTQEPIAIRDHSSETAAAAMSAQPPVSGLLYFEEAWVSNVEGERLQMLRGETLLQRASVKWMLNQRSEALGDASAALKSLLSDRNLDPSVYATKMKSDALQQLIRGRKVESSLLLGLCFECCAGLSKLLGHEQEHAAYQHNAVELLRGLRAGYESGSLKYKEDAKSAALDDHKGDVMLDMVNETVQGIHGSSLQRFDQIVDEYRRRCLPEAAAAAAVGAAGRGEKARAIRSASKKASGASSPDGGRRSSSSQKQQGQRSAASVKRVGSAPAVVRSHAKPVAGSVPPCDSLGRSVSSWAIKRAEPGGYGPQAGPSRSRPHTAGSAGGGSRRRRPGSASSSHPVVPRGGSASRLRALSNSSSFMAQYPMSAEWLRNARPSTAGSQRSSDAPSPMQVWSRMSPAQQQQTQTQTQKQRRRQQQSGFAQQHERSAVNFAAAGLLAEA